MNEQRLKINLKMYYNKCTTVILHRESANNRSKYQEPRMQIRTNSLQLILNIMTSGWVAYANPKGSCKKIILFLMVRTLRPYPPSPHLELSGHRNFFSALKKVPIP